MISTVPRKNFVVTTHSHDRVILTYDQVKELASAPDETVSIQHSIVEADTPLL